MIRVRPDSVLGWLALLHVAVAIACAIGLLRDAPPIVGVHPMWKPLKFALSIAVFLGTMALVVPLLSVSAPSRRVLAWLLAAAMALEMLAIAAQALRGTTSHYNVATGFDRLVWHAMLVAIIAITVAMAAVAWVATFRPLRDAAGAELPAWTALAWRAALWMFQLTAITGFAMGGRGQHTVGAVDGGPGLPAVNWSVVHGDLRIPHFLTIHAIQILPLIAAGVGMSGLSERGRWASVLAAIALQALVIGWTLVRAFLGRTPW